MSARRFALALSCATLAACGGGEAEAPAPAGPPPLPRRPEIPDLPHFAEHRRAIDALEREREARPDDATVGPRLAEAYVALSRTLVERDEPPGERRYRIALFALRRALALDPDNVEARRGISSVEATFRMHDRPVPEE